MTFERITDDELAQVCEEEGFPSIGGKLACGETQEQATAYMVDLPLLSGDEDDDEAFGFYDDPGGKWLKGYVTALAMNRADV